MEEKKVNTPPDSKCFETMAKIYVMNYHNDHLDPSLAESCRIDIKDVYVVWFNKTLQNFKVLLSTNVPDGMYYEVTYNGDKDESYMDVYRRVDHKVFLDYERNDIEVFNERITDIVKKTFYFEDPKNRDTFINNINKLANDFLSNMQYSRHNYRDSK